MLHDVPSVDAEVAQRHRLATCPKGNIPRSMCLGHDLAVKVVLQQQPHHGCGRADPGKLHRIFVTSMTVLWLYGSCVTPTPVPLRPRMHKVP